MRIRTKMFIANMLVVTLLLSVLTQVLIHYVSNILLDKAKENAVSSVSQLALNIDNACKTYERVIDSFYINTDLQDALLSTYGSTTEAQNVYFEQVSPYLNNVEVTTDALQMTVYANNPTFQFSDARLINDEVEQSDWYTQANQSSARLSRHWMDLGRSDVYKANVIRLVGKLYNIFYRSEIFITLDIDQRMFERLIEKEDKNQRYIVALSNSHVIVDSAESSEGKRFLTSYNFYSDIANLESASTIYRENGQAYLLVSKTINSRSSVTGTKVVSLVPIKAYVSKVNEVKKVAMWLFAIALCVSMLIIYAISSSLTKRLIILTNKIKRMNPDNLDDFIEVKGNDEISQVSSVFNQMMVRMDRLIKQVYESELHQKVLELKKRESELYALQTQINPHYLFNTLNAIRGSLLENGDFKNADMVKWFAQSFRNVLNNNDDIIRVREELGTVETYMRVQGFRYGARLVFTTDVPEELLDYPIPRLALHTLIENALVHGLEKNEEATHVSVTGEPIDESSYQLIVSDNGPGISEEQLAAIEERLKQSEALNGNKHFGLSNIQGRIRMTFGNRFGLAIERNDGKGATVHMVLPTSRTISGSDTEHV